MKGNVMNLTRRQELALIQYAIERFTEDMLNGKAHRVLPEPKAKTKGRKWTKSQHQKFSQTMKKKWMEREK